MKTVFPELEKLNWTTVNDQSVNPTPADQFAVTPWPGGMTTSISGTAWAGALGRTPDLPLMPGTSIFKLSYDMMLPGSVLVLGEALEFDMMIADPEGDVANGSCQCVVSRGGMWQIAGPGGDWVDTGFETDLCSNEWIEVKTKVRVNWDTGGVSFQSIEVDGDEFDIPNDLQNVPLQDLNWGPNLIVVQRQLVVGKNGGAFTVDDSHIKLTQE